MSTKTTRFTHAQTVLILALSNKGYTPRDIAAYLNTIPNTPHRTPAAIKARIARGLGVRPPIKLITPDVIASLHLPTSPVPVMPRREDYKTYTAYRNAYAAIWSELSYTDQEAVGHVPPDDDDDDWGVVFDAEGRPI